MWKHFSRIIQNSYTDEEYRRTVLFILLNLLLCAVALVMTIVNWRTREYELMGVTAVFALLCALNFTLIHVKRTRSNPVFSFFSVEVVALLVYFVLGGIPEGFSALWTLLVPSLGLSIFGKKMGTRLSILVFAMVIFFFWLPFGQSLLYYEYSKTFMLRFPFVYICLFLASLYVESIRLGAYAKLKETEETARHLYRHDALTGIYNRHAFFEDLQQMFETPSENKVAILILDVDDFKSINDQYGHNAGDLVLKTVAKIISDNTCEHCFTCRWGGEEFLVLMQCEHDPLELSEHIREVIETTIVPYEGHSLSVTVSIGIAVTEKLESAQLSSFINCADKAMYRSKDTGKNSIHMERYCAKNGF